MIYPSFPSRPPVKIWFKRVRLSVLFVMVGWFAASLYGSSNVIDVKNHAPEAWKQAGFNIVGYEGYELSFCFREYGCGDVWYTLQREPDNGIVYHGYLKRWGSEYHIYSLTAIDAIKPRNTK